MTATDTERRFVRVNLNHTVRVRVMPEGWPILERYYGQFPFDCSELVDGWREVDAEGYTHKQLWHVMEVFGPHMHIGMNVPIETDIFVEVQPPTP